ncbi:DoxX family protein [Blastopirellula marina]|uniref:DoxX family protein n=1 Tax=Blastopirellula marina TaxID=124 RepID=A0A2S8F2A7_9BACT|nr:DoxX family protein [Blastopirellula marina]PQO26302.1 DoxX family protein [Blastopirellula marina]PQO47182.1 DoxX family protein [Blastopirellula marina]PTL40702.1 DoxX family protein [Blastopirellula marina]
MNNAITPIVSIAGRVMLATIFVLSAVGNKIPNFDGVAGYMASVGVPAPHFLLAGAILFLIVGGASVAAGFYARIGASLLLVFLVLATYYFHDFWNLEGQEAQMQTIQFMKNLSMAGAMVYIIANGSGAGSLDGSYAAQRETIATNELLEASKG